MKVVQITPGKFHHFDLARQLNERNSLAAIFTGYPRWKLNAQGELHGLPGDCVHTFPWLLAPYFAIQRYASSLSSISRFSELLARKNLYALDWFAARHLPPCDALIALSGTGLSSGRRAQGRGAIYICDRGSTHIRFQNDILREEHGYWQLPYTPIRPEIMEREEDEYLLADLITIPSQFVADSFSSRGVLKEKLRVVPYGVDLSKFTPTAQPRSDIFQVLFVGSVSLRKGVPYLLQAFAKLQNPRKRLVIAGTVAPQISEFLKKFSISREVHFLGHVRQNKLSTLMGESQVMVLPTIEEGLALVLAQALASGCPIISTPNSGAENLIRDGDEGFIVPVRNPEAILEKLELLAERPMLRQSMSTAAIARSKIIGGWNDYGEKMISILKTGIMDRAVRS